MSQKHVDFVLYDPWTSGIAAVIELDDRSHDELHRRRRDEFLNEALLSAGVPLLRVKAAHRYDRVLLCDQLCSAIKAGITISTNQESSRAEMVERPERPENPDPPGQA